MLPAPDAVRLLHVFSGDVDVGGFTLRAEGKAYLTGEEGRGQARSDVELVLFATDPVAPVFRAGMFSGNVLSG